MAWQPVEIRPNEQQAIISQLKPGFGLDLKIVCLIFRWKGIRGAQRSRLTVVFLAVLQRLIAWGIWPADADR